MARSAAEPRLKSAEDLGGTRAEGVKRKPKILKSLRIERTLDGGHAVHHEHTSYEHDRSYNFGPNDGERAAAHIARHIGLPHYSRRAESETEVQMGKSTRDMAMEEND